MGFTNPFMRVKMYDKIHKKQSIVDTHYDYRIDPMTLMPTIETVFIDMLKTTKPEIVDFVVSWFKYADDNEALLGLFAEQYKCVTNTAVGHRWFILEYLDKKYDLYVSIQNCSG